MPFVAYTVRFHAYHIFLLMIYRSELLGQDTPGTQTSQTNPRFALTALGLQSCERIVFGAIVEFRKAHDQAVKLLLKPTTPKWYGPRLSGPRTPAIEQWLSKHASLVRGCAKHISSELRLQHKGLIRRQILASLLFPEIQWRYNAVTKATAKTLDWLFDSDGTTQTSGDSFANWLQDTDSTCNKLFWVRGKPASGKSTLMRLLKDDARTRSLATTWSGSQELVVASCFFWSSGTALQKSQQGLLQTLLYQLLTAHSEFGSALFQSRWSLLELEVTFDQFQSTQSWSLEELRHAIFTFIHLSRSSLKFLILVDGLDEYQGDDQQRQEVCSFLKQLSEIDTVKVCASSRPWNIYKDMFQNNPRLKLEDKVSHAQPPIDRASLTRGARIAQSVPV